MVWCLLTLNSRPVGWCLCLAGLRHGCFLEDWKSWEIWTRLGCVPVVRPGTGERGGCGHFARVSSEGNPLGPGIGGQAFLGCQDGLDSVKRPVQSCSRVSQLPGEPGALGDSGLPAA